MIPAKPSQMIFWQVIRGLIVSAYTRKGPVRGRRWFGNRNNFFCSSFSVSPTLQERGLDVCLASADFTQRNLQTQLPRIPWRRNPTQCRMELIVVWWIFGSGTRHTTRFGGKTHSREAIDLLTRSVGRRTRIHDARLIREVSLQVSAWHTRNAELGPGPPSAIGGVRRARCLLARLEGPGNRGRGPAIEPQKDLLGYEGEATRD